MATKKLSGQVVDYRTAQLSGMSEKHVLAKIRTNSGRTIVADLGPVNNLRQQQTRLRKGQKMQGSGRTGRVNDLPVIILDTFIGDGQFTVIAPEIRSQNDIRRRSARASQGQSGRQQQARTTRGQSGSQQQARQYLVRGQIQDMRQMNIRGTNQSHRIAKLRTSGGQTVIVDLGTGRELQDVSLRPNEWIQVLGTPGRINSRPAIFAEAIADVATINRQQSQNQRGAQRTMMRR